MSTTTEFLDPRAQPKAVAEPYDIKVDLDSPLTIGLVANGFPDSVRFLDHVEKTIIPLWFSKVFRVCLPVPLL